MIYTEKLEVGKYSNMVCIAQRRRRRRRLRPRSAASVLAVGAAKFHLSLTSICGSSVDLVIYDEYCKY